MNQTLTIVAIVISALSLLSGIVSAVVAALLSYIVRQKDSELRELRAKVGRTFEALDNHKDDDGEAHSNLRERIHSIEVVISKLDQLDGIKASIDALRDEVVSLRAEVIKLKATGPGRYASKPSTSSLPAASDPPRKR